MKFFQFSLPVFLTAVLFGLGVQSLSAQENPNISILRQSLDSIDFQIFVAGFSSDDSLNEAIRQVSKQRSRILECIETRERALESTTQTIGQELVDSISKGLPKSRDEARVSSQIDQNNEIIKECKLLLEKSNQLLERMSELQSKLREQELVERFPNFFKVLPEGLVTLGSYLKLTLNELLQLPGVAVTRGSWMRGTLVVVIGLLVGLLINRRTKRLVPTEDAPVFSQILDLIRYSLKRVAPLLLPLIGLGVYMVAMGGYQFANSHLNEILKVLVLFILAQVLLSAWIKRYSKFAEITYQQPFPARGLYWRLVIALSMLTLGAILISIPDQPMTNNPAQVLFRNLLTAAMLVVLIELAVFLGRVPQIPRIANAARLVAIFLFSLSLILELVGYHSLSKFFWVGIVLSAFALTGFYILERLFRYFYDGLENGQGRGQVKFRQMLSVQPDEPVPGLIWLRLISMVALWVFLGLILLKAWGVSDSTVLSMTSTVSDGFRIGDSLIKPISVLLGIVTFSLLLMVFRWFKDGLDRKYLERSRMESGAREATLTITGYVGFVIAALTGLTIAGVEFGNIAIIAGALSLGIGFGLQNIVNNFVSGIILLFERPIKTGDWIITGTTEGYVKKIRVRSTEVQTFDKADVIVPNSELISTQVTNWTLRNKYGRVVISVGVAYGSDTEMVRELLYSATEGIPEIVQNQPSLATNVLFLNFGESSLDFQLRCFIHNIETILEVKSKLHFAIDKVFRENNIEIAFPQRDLHIRSGNLPTHPVSD